MELNIAAPDQSGNKSIKVSDTTFGYEYNEALIHQVVTAYMSGARAGTKAQKTRAEVSGGGAKPWRQKGTGRARAGSSRSPLWRKGGKSFAATPRDYTQKVNRKMYKGAMCSILSELARQGRLLVVENFVLNEPKTRELVNKLEVLNVTNVMVVSDEIDRNLILAARNLHKVHVCLPAHINPANLIAFDQVVVTVNALKQIEEVLQ